MEELKVFAPFIFKWELVGSAAINGEGEDIDIALRVNEGDKQEIAKLCHQTGYEVGGSGPQEGAPEDFRSFKKGEYNLLFCYDDESYDRFVKGAKACIFLKNLGVDMTDKKVRVAVHGLIARQDEETLIKEIERIYD